MLCSLNVVRCVLRVVVVACRRPLVVGGCWFVVRVVVRGSSLFVVLVCCVWLCVMCRWLMSVVVRCVLYVVCFLLPQVCCACRLVITRCVSYVGAGLCSCWCDVCYCWRLVLLPFVAVRCACCLLCVFCTCLMLNVVRCVSLLCIELVR